MMDKVGRILLSAACGGGITGAAVAASDGWGFVGIGAGALLGANATIWLLWVVSRLDEEAASSRLRALAEPQETP